MSRSVSQFPLFVPVPPTITPAAQLLAEYDRLRPEVVALSGSAIWHRDQFEAWLATPDSESAAWLSEVWRQLDWYSTRAVQLAVVDLAEAITS